MKIIKSKSRQYKKKSYYEYRVIISKDIFDAVEFNQDGELIVEARNGAIILKRKLK